MLKSFNSTYNLMGDVSYKDPGTNLYVAYLRRQIEFLVSEDIYTQNRDITKQEIFDFFMKNVPHHLKLIDYTDAKNGSSYDSIFVFSDIHYKTINPVTGKEFEPSISAYLHFSYNRRENKLSVVVASSMGIENNSFKNLIYSFFSGYDRKNLVSWAFLTNGDTKIVKANLKPFLPVFPELYPFIPNFSTFIEEYLESDSPILILNGPKGTGKSSFIKHFIKNYNRNVIISYDKDLLKKDTFYSDFICGDFDDYDSQESSPDLMVMEDADLLLFKRVELENDMMSKLLNVSDGILDIKKKKIIFTANLENTDKIDTAILRPGRCFKLINFRNLTLDEANVVRKKLNKPEFTTGKSFSLAEIFQ